MQLITAHKILIGSGIAMFALYGLLGARHALAGESSWLATGLSFGACVLLALYLRWLLRRRGIRPHT